MSTPSPPFEHRTMDIAMSHFLLHFPTTPLEMLMPERDFEVISETNAEYKAIESYTDKGWKIKIDGKERLVLYEEMTLWDTKILDQLHFRKTVFRKVHRLEPVGVILLPEKSTAPEDQRTTFISGAEDMPHTLDQNYILSLSHPKIKSQTNHPGQVLINLLNVSTELPEAIDLVVNIRDLIKDHPLLQELQGIAYYFVARRFGEEPLKELWKRIKPMMATSNIYREAVEEGHIKGVEEGRKEGRLKGKAEALI